MALTAKSIQDLLRGWAGTLEGQKRMKACISKAVTSGGKLASGSKVPSTRDMSAAAADMISIVRNKMPSSISDIAMFASTPQKNGDGDYVVYLNFDESALHRDSLENDEREYDGIDNIVALLNNGMHASGFTYGWWNGHKPTGESLAFSVHGAEDYAWVRSVKDRDPLLFMQSAVAEFDTKYSKKYGAKAVLSDDYTENHRWK